MEQAYDLTEGNIKRQLIYLSIPLLIGNISFFSFRWSSHSYN
nr:hypothetical protein [uncultured Intestinibacter sp.]